MRQEKGLQNIIIVVLAIAVMVMAVGFADFSTDLNITGTATFSRAVWDIHFDSTTIDETSTITASAGPTVNQAGDSITYTVTLAKPGDEYDFNVDVVNGGTIDGTLSEITFTGINTATHQDEFITHTVTITDSTNNPVTYTPSSTLTGLTHDIAKNGGTQNVAVHVAYKDNGDPTYLPSSDATVTLNITLHYIAVNQ